MNCIKFRMSVCTLLRNIAMLVIILIGSMKTVAQEWDHEYFPFVEEGKVWNCCAISPQNVDIANCFFTMSGDTLINDNTYKKVSCQFKDFYGDEEQHYYCAVREEDYRVFIVEAETKEEKMLYDFSHPQEDIILSYDGRNFARGAGFYYGNVFPPTGQLCFKIFEGDVVQGPTCYPYNIWVEGAGPFLGNPFVAGGLIDCGDEPDPIFGYPLYLISCIKGEKRMYHTDWSAVIFIDPEDEEEEGDPTSIQEMSKSTPDAPIYDLQGRRLSAAPQKGVYIQNGKKKLVK